MLGLNNLPVSTGSIGGRRIGWSMRGLNDLPVSTGSISAGNTNGQTGFRPASPDSKPKRAFAQPGGPSIGDTLAQRAYPLRPHPLWKAGRRTKLRV
jgi:hypothetical protein